MPSKLLGATGCIFLLLTAILALAAEVAPAPSGGTRTADLFKKLDKNGDGKLLPAEAPFPRWFARVDVNQDGVITLEEAEKALGEFVPDRMMQRLAPAPTAPAPVATPAVPNPFQDAPKQLKASEHGVGRMIPAITLHDLRGQAVPLFAEKSTPALVVGIVSATCPVSNKIGLELARIEKDYTTKGVRFVWVDAISSDTPADIQKYATGHHLVSPVFQDPDGSLVRALQAGSSTEAFVLDAAHTLIYRGAVNDQYGLGYAKAAPEKNYLRDALDAVLGGKIPEIAATTAPGCVLDTSKPVTASPTDLTYDNQIARIIQGNCVECHRPGGIAPFSLDTYENVLGHAGMIKHQVSKGAMPPWFAAPPAPGHASEWSNDRSLSVQDKADLIAWLDSNRPQGNPADAPVPRIWPPEWVIGQPDLIVQLPQPVAIQAEGTMPYQYINVQTTLTEDKWVQAYQVMPTDRAVVHHAIITVQAKGVPAPMQGESAAAGNYWAAYVPGNAFQIYPAGYARKLPAGATITFQIHYTPNGKATTDQMRMGLVFAKEPPKYAVETLALPKRNLLIPPGEANHVETVDRIIPRDLNVMACLAHMHFRGKAFKIELVHADGSTEPLLDIPHYDFNWQLRYDLAQTRVIPAGSRIRLTAVFDNSADNPANPDPTKTVYWGPQTSDEMMIGYIEHFVPL